MAADSPPPPPPPAPTTITALGDDLLLDIFLRLPDVTTLARAAFACHTFLHAVRSSPAFRRRFRELHAPPLLALFKMPYMCAIVPAISGKSSDIAAAFDGVLHDSEASEWQSDPIPYTDWYANFLNQSTNQCARYSPHSQALKIFPKNSRDRDAFLEFHTLFPDGDEQRPSRVVCVHRDHAWAWARVAVFSAQTMKWQVVLPEMDTGGLLIDYDRCATGKVVNGFVCWLHKGQGCILAQHCDISDLSDLAPLFKVPFKIKFRRGQTKDGKFCVVSVLKCMLSLWLWAADGDGVERFMLHKTISLRANVSEITKCSEEADVRMRPVVVINGFVYLSLIIDNSGDRHSPECFLSFYLETTEVNLLHKEWRRIYCSVHPYFMLRWPSSLIHDKEDSETGVTEDDYPIGTEETSPVLFTALRSFKENLIDDGSSNFAEIHSFLLEDERNSLLNRIATFESGLAGARDLVLRICTEPNSMEGMKFVTSELGLAAATESVLRIATESDSMEEMERVSCWQMCKMMLCRGCSRFFTR